MSKDRKGRGVIAIAVFEAAAALERVAAAEERRNALLEADVAARQAAIDSQREIEAARWEAIAADLAANTPARPGSASLLEQYRHAARELVKTHRYMAGQSHICDAGCTVAPLAEVVRADA